MNRYKTFIFSLFISFCLLLGFYSCKKKPAQIPVDLKQQTVLCGPDYVGKMKVAVVVYNGVEVVDMNGPIDVFTKTNRIRNHYYVYTVAADDTLVQSEQCAVAIKPRYNLRNCPRPDIVIIPGCPPDVVTQLLADTAFGRKVLGWVTELGKDPEKEIMAVCTGVLLLGKTGLLDGRKATTHYLALDELAQLYPAVQVVRNVRFAEDRNTVTTAGITSGIDGALHLVEKYEGKAVADSVAHIMVYNRSCPMRDTIQ